MEQIILYAGFTLAFLIEARHDYQLAITEAALLNFRKQQGKPELQESDKKRKRAWHRLSFFYFAVLAATAAFLLFGFTYAAGAVALALGFLRILVFNIALNYHFRIDWYYVSAEGFEGKMKGKERLYYLASAVFLIALVFISNLNPLQ